MKKTFALVLSVLLLVGLLAGCGGADKEIVGTWETSLEMANYLNEEFAAEGNYETKDGKLYLSDGKEYQVDPEIYEVYTIEGDKMTFVESVGGDADDDMAELYPLEFQRVG